MKEQEPPNRIQLHPTGFHPASLSARILDFIYEHRVGLHGLAAAFEVMAADCRRDLWFVSDVKGKVRLSEDEWVQLLEYVDTADKRCSAAMAALAAGGPPEAFCAEMEAVARLLNDRALPPAL
jgi:hypothetical protein